MTYLSKATGKTQNEIKAIYLSAIDTLIFFGMNEEEARKEVQTTLKLTIGL